MTGCVVVTECLRRVLRLADEYSDRVDPAGPMNDDGVILAALMAYAMGLREKLDQDTGATPAEIVPRIHPANETCH